MRIFALLFCSLVFIVPSFAATDPVVAKVNSATIKKSELEQAYAENRLHVSGQSVTRRKVLNDLINRQLGIQRAKADKLQRDPTVRLKIEDILYHAKVSKDLGPRLNKITVTNSDIKSYYKGYPEYRTAHILLRMRAMPSPQETAAARETAMKVYRSVLKSPKKFAQLANKYSQTNTAPNGGDMGFQPAVRLAPEYFKAIKGRPKGHITPPIRTQFGYHIIKVLGVRNYDGINKSLYKKIVYNQKRDKVLANYFSQIRKKAQIRINEKYLTSPPPSRGP